MSVPKIGSTNNQKAAPRVVSDSGGGLLLDKYPNAAVAYSCRQLRSDYDGLCMRVRRDSDSVEFDIGFVNGLIDALYLKQIGDTCHVLTWYDQSGNGNNASWSTASEIPRITLSGVVDNMSISSGSYIEEVPPYCIVNENNGRLILDNYLTGSQGFLFSVSRNFSDPATSAGLSGPIIGNVGAVPANFNSHRPFTDGIIYDGFASTVRKTAGNPTESLTNRNIMTIVSQTNYWELRLQKESFYTTTTNTVGYNSTREKPQIGRSNEGGTIRYFNGRIAEVIIYTEDVYAMLQNIENEISEYYAI